MYASTVLERDQNNRMCWLRYVLCCRQDGGLTTIGRVQDFIRDLIGGDVAGLRDDTAVFVVDPSTGSTVA